MSDRVIRSNLAGVLARLDNEARAASGLAERCANEARAADGWGLSDDAETLTEKARLYHARAQMLEASGAGIRARLAS